MKEKFIYNEIWTLTFGAAFQRAYVYLADVGNDKKEIFKRGVREFIEDNLDHQYSIPMDDSQHIKNIYSLAEYTSSFKELLTERRLNFGVSQKLLNLHLKYLWCLEKISIPPHFPVDRRIQEITGFSPIVNWTEFSDEIEYMKIINHVRKKVKVKQTIAEFELEHFERRVKTK